MNKWLSLVKILAPIILTTVKPELAPIADKISDGINEAEQIKGATGTDKLNHVQGIAFDAAAAINTAKGKTVVDTSSLHEAVQEGVDTTVAVVNLLNKKPTTPK